MSTTDRSLAVYARFDERQRQTIRSLLSEELVAEHRANPLGRRGPQSDALRRVLNYFRRAPLADKRVVVAVEPWRRYRVGRLSGVRGEPPELPDGPAFSTEEEALHAVFLERVRELGRT